MMEYFNKHTLKFIELQLIQNTRLSTRIYPRPLSAHRCGHASSRRAGMTVRPCRLPYEVGYEVNVSQDRVVYVLAEPKLSPSARKRHLFCTRQFAPSAFNPRDLRQ